MKSNRIFIIGILFMGSSSLFYLHGQTRCADLYYQNARYDLREGNIPGAVDHGIKTVEVCEDFNKDHFEFYLGITMDVIGMFEEGTSQHQKYIGFLLVVLERMESLGSYTAYHDMIRGYYYTQLSQPNYYMADRYFQKAFSYPRVLEIEFEEYIEIYFYNVYALWYVEQDPNARHFLKQRLIKEHAYLSGLIDELGYTASIKNRLNYYLDQAN